MHQPLTPERPRHRARRDRGSALLLFPAAILVMFVLGALAVDAALVSQRTRRLDQLAAAAANDAVSFGIDPDAVRASGDVVIDPSRARLAAEATLAATGVTFDVPPEIVVDGPRVRVELRQRVPYVFSGAVPGAPDSFVAHGRAVARAVEGRP